MSVAGPGIREWQVALSLESRLGLGVGMGDAAERAGAKSRIGRERFVEAHAVDGRVGDSDELTHAKAPRSADGRTGREDDPHLGGRP